jgi:hypothetical protein
MKNFLASHMLMLPCLFLVPPRWMVEPTDHSVVQGNPVSLHCQVDGFPKPTITWKQAVGMYLFQNVL